MPRAERCKFFAKTGMKSPPDKECLVCPLREKNGDCLQDIADFENQNAQLRTSDIWSKYWKNFYKPTKV